MNYYDIYDNIYSLYSGWFSVQNSLTEINLDDLVAAFGWQQHLFLRAGLRFVFRGAATKFAAQMADFDRQVGLAGLPGGARKTLHRYVKDVRVFGQENLLPSGPVLYLSNHPGMTDTLCLFAALRRPDLRIIAYRRPFLQALPNIMQHLIPLSDDPGDRVGAVRKASSHLRAGGAVLTFPAGEIEPDPDVYDGANQALDAWLDSAGVFMRFAPETKIVPILVRNVLWDKAVTHPLTHFRSGRLERERLGASFQLLLQILFNLAPVTVKVQVAPPIGLSEVGSTDTAAIHASVLTRMRSLLQNPPVGAGAAAL
jgi:1-acyl-sn-glycerol-3-phosphate acyltransferase